MVAQHRVKDEVPKGRNINRRPSHVAIVDWQLHNPTGKVSDLAEYLGVSKQLIYIMCGTDGFKDYQSRRFAEHEKGVSTSLIGDAEDMTRGALREMTKRVKSEAELLPCFSRREAAERGLRALLPAGRGAVGPAGGNVNVFVGVTKETLAEARGQMKVVQGHEAPQDAELLPPTA